MISVVNVQIKSSRLNEFTAQEKKNTKVKVNAYELQYDILEVSSTTSPMKESPW